MRPGLRNLLMAGVLGAGLCSPARATSPATDYISGVSLSGGGNYGFRIFLRNSASLSGCTGGFAFVNSSFDNYQAYVSALLSAYISGKSVTVYYTSVTGSFCQIGDFSVNG